MQEQVSQQTIDFWSSTDIFPEVSHGDTAGYQGDDSPRHADAHQYLKRLEHHKYDVLGELEPAEQLFMAIEESLTIWLAEAAEEAPQDIAIAFAWDRVPCLIEIKHVAELLVSCGFEVIWNWQLFKVAEDVWVRDVPVEIQCLWLSQRGRHTTLFLDFIDVFTLLKEYLGDKLLDDLIQVVLDLREHAEDLE